MYALQIEWIIQKYITIEHFLYIVLIDLIIDNPVFVRSYRELAQFHEVLLKVLIRCKKRGIIHTISALID